MLFNKRLKELLYELMSLQLLPTNYAKNGLPYHEWFIEFEKEPEDLEDFASKIDNAMRKQNIYYDDLIVGKVLRISDNKKSRKTVFKTI